MRFMAGVRFSRYGFREERWGTIHPMHRTHDRQHYDTSITEEEEEYARKVRVSYTI